MAAADAVTLSTATRLQPNYQRARSQSPSRSPIRKAQFTARELDPLLSNLSPDSTLQALQRTQTISGGAAQDALAQSVADASPAEREMGIRAAFAAQKLREWRNELSWWIWPNPEAARTGKGFLPPTVQGELPDNVVYLGYLPLELVNRYATRLEDIKDGIEALEMDEIKDHVLHAHSGAPRKEGPATDSPGSRASYGRLRDFTALITATVIQALPDLAQLNQLLHMWDIRLRVLRHLPDLQQAFNVTSRGLRAAFKVVHDPIDRYVITVQDFETTREILQRSVSDLGAKVDVLLDMLQGSQDVLPQVWIDTLENIESDYATWVVHAEHIALKNKMDSPAPLQQPSEGTYFEKLSHVTPQPISSQQPLQRHQMGHAAMRTYPTGSSDDADSDSTTAPIPNGSSIPRKPPSNTIMSEAKHRRDISKASIANSTFSNISEGEIVGAQRANLTHDPVVTLVNNPARMSEDGLTLVGANTARHPQLVDTPDNIQQASAASIEFVPRDQVKRVSFRQSTSHDFIPATAYSTTATTTSSPSPPMDEIRMGTSHLQSHDDSQLTSRSKFAGSLAPTSAIPPLSLRTGGELENDEDQLTPVLPRRSSKRGSFTNQPPFSPVSPIGSDSDSPLIGLTSQKHLIQPTHETMTPIRSGKKAAKPETLEDKIQDILTTLPTRIRLAKDEEDASRHSQSQTPDRSGTPLAHLTLSPVKAEKSSRTAGGTDVRVFQLSQSGSSRDTPPVKLFVRAVGEHGERVMVRVGGGWADLGEYLREYSAHHGNRSLEEGRLELATYPKAHKETTSTALAAARHKNKPSTSSPSVGGSTRPADFQRSITADLPMMASEVNVPQSVPSSVSNTYTVTSPVTTVVTGLGGFTRTTVRNSTLPVTSDGPMFDNLDPSTPAPARQSTFPTTTTPISNSNTTTPGVQTPSYTPLGAAGPRLGGKRAVTHGAAPSLGNEALVDGIVVKARAASGGYSNGTTTHVIHGPTFTTTTTTTFSTGTPYQSRSIQPLDADTPEKRSSPPNSTTAHSSPLPSSIDQSPAPTPPQVTRPVSGIRRVFLKRKSDVQRTS